jgi:hypothetical protein
VISYDVFFCLYQLQINCSKPHECFDDADNTWSCAEITDMVVFNIGLSVDKTHEIIAGNIRNGVEKTGEIVVDYMC